MTDADDLPVAVYTGEYANALFLASLLEGSGITANLVQSHHTQVPHSVVIARRDLAVARPLIEDFMSGKASDESP